MKLELKHIAPYLPYVLKAEILDYEKDYVGKQYDEIIGLHKWYKNKDWVCLTAGGSKPSFDTIKPILRPLSDLTKEIEVNGEKFVPIECLEEKYYTLDLHKQCLRLLEENGENWINQSEYMLVNYLFEWHFDVFGLIENGLAIDINTLNK